MMRAPTLLPLVVLVAAVAPAASQVRGPSDVQVPVGKLVPLTLTVDADDTTVAVLGGEAFSGFREFTDPKTYQFQLLGYQPGGGYVILGTTKAGKLQALFVVKVTVGAGPVPPLPPTPPGPTPTPPDVPPLPPDNPPDERVAFPAVRKAAKVLPVDDLVKLAMAHRRAIAGIDAARTPIEAAGAVNAELAGLGKYPPADLEVQLDKALASVMDYNAPALTDADRGRIKDALRRIADSLEGK